ncbi:MAG: hypothetical protein AAFZ15_02250 [Bacteroidota bacterium]
MFPTISFFIAGLIIFAAVYFSITTDIIRNPSDVNSATAHKRYSFSRTQLMWWTVIISCCFIIMFGETGGFELNSTTLILLGIGAATTTGGSVIDASQAQAAKATGTVRHQDSKSTHFLHDILSDGHGVSTHRFQALVFNILFGFIFVAFFFKHGYQFTEFNQYELGTLGISSGSYLAMKTNENKSPANQAQQEKPPSNNQSS